MKIESIGTQADTAAHVDISKVHGGYFSNGENLAQVIQIGIEPLLNNFNSPINFVDFGGGQGHLAAAIQKYLDTKGILTNTLVADANEEYLNTARSMGLETKLCNLEEEIFPETDLITMRAVLHYNSPQNQVKILRNAYASLKPGGYLVHVNSSGNNENCKLRSAIVNIPELGRAGSGKYHWISEINYIDMARESGFNSTAIVGYAQPNKWGPEEQWDRFNSHITKKAFMENNSKLLQEIEVRKKAYLEKAYFILAEYTDEYGADHLGITTCEGKKEISYTYPIIVSRK